MKCFYTKEFSKKFLELHHKMWVYVTHNCLGYSKMSYNMYTDNFSVPAILNLLSPILQGMIIVLNS